MATITIPQNTDNVEVHVTKLELNDATQNEPSMDDIKDKMKKPTIGITLMLFLILNIVMFVVGVTTVHQCPIQPLIPIYLAVAGAVGILTKVISMVNYNKQIRWLNILVSVIYFFEFVWMIVGSVWIYSIYQPNYIPEVGAYCHKTAYLMAFWLLTLHYVCILLVMLIPGFIVCCLWAWCMSICE